MERERFLDFGMNAKLVQNMVKVSQSVLQVQFEISKYAYSRALVRVVWHMHFRTE